MEFVVVLAILCSSFRTGPEIVIYRDFSKKGVAKKSIFTTEKIMPPLNSIVTI